MVTNSLQESAGIFNTEVAMPELQLVLNCRSAFQNISETGQVRWANTVTLKAVVKVKDFSTCCGILRFIGTPNMKQLIMWGSTLDFTK